jgi:hypothetical protein
MAKVITVVAATVDKVKVVFYTDTGSTEVIKQGDPRLTELLATLMPRINRGERVTIDLGSYSLYGQFEKKSNMLVRFFKAAKSAVQAVVETLVQSDMPVDSDVPQQTVNPVVQPQTPPTVAPTAPVEEPKVEATIPAPAPQKPRYEDLKDKLEPVADDNLQPDETLVAVINGVAIPGIEKLKPYLAHAVKHNSTKAVVSFLERISRVIDQRGHSIPDLLRFLERGDLPLAEDGSIIAYKILRKSKAHQGFKYVDCHTGKVHQRLGTYVRVEEKLVDKNRHNECSNGLHVARRGYIGQFSGDVCVMIKMPPEDVIAVPHNDPNKVRCMGYHIIFELSDHVYNVLRANRPMTSDSEAAAMLAKAISGDHIGVTEEVWIGGQGGSNLSIKNAIHPEDFEKEVKKAVVTETANVPESAKAFDHDGEDKPVGAVYVDPRAMAKEIKEDKAKAALETPLDDYNRIIQTNDRVGAQAWIDKKKRAKKPYTSWGLPENAGERLKAIIDGYKAEITNAVASHVTSDKDDPIVSRNAKAAQTEPKDQKADEFFGTKKVKPMGNAEKARKMFEQKDWRNLWILKKTAKKSWEALGFNAKEEERIKTNKPSDL